MRIISGALACALLLGATAAHAQANKSGWWVRMDTAVTVADTVELSTGTARANLAPAHTWTKGAAAEFDLPAALNSATAITVRAKGTPAQADVRFCVYYGATAVEEFDFDGTDTETVRQNGHEEDCR